MSITIMYWGAEMMQTRLENTELPEHKQEPNPGIYMNIIHVLVVFNDIMMILWKGTCVLKLIDQKSPLQIFRNDSINED